MKRWLDDRPRVGDLLALASGALLPAAFAPYGLFPLALILPAVLFVLWLEATPRRTFWRGLLFGVGYFGLGVYWVYISIAHHGGAHPAVAALVTAGFVVVLALFPALAGYVVNRWLRGAEAWRLIVAFPAAFVALEWVRGWLFTGFPWLALGYSQIDAAPAGFAPLGGVYAVSLVTLVSAGLVAWVLHARVVGKWVGLAALLALWGAGWALGAVTWTQPDGKAMVVSLVQGNVAQEHKWDRAAFDATLDRYRDLTHAHWSSDLIVWPETSVPAFYHQVASRLIEPLERAAREHDAALLIGLPVKDLDSGHYYNSVLAVGEGERQFYHKRHLVPFGEFIPLQDYLGRVLDVLSIRLADYKAGEPDQTLLDVDGRRAGISICYEDAFGTEVAQALPEADFLVNVSNDAWFGDSVAPPQHLEIARMRARETGRYLLRATNTGVTAVIDHRGRVQSEAPAFEVHVLTDTLVPMRGATPYVRLGNAPVIGLVVAALAVGAWRVRRRSSATPANASDE